MLRCAIFILCLYPIIGLSQINLVPNYSFENISQCPYAQGQLDFAVPWFYPTIQNPELFHACQISGGFGVPNNMQGYQIAKTDTGYCGGFFWGNGSEVRDYISIQLTDTLTLNKQYLVEFHVSLADKCIWGSDKIGLYFSDTLVDNVPTMGLLNFIPQIENPSGNIITDTMNWTKISGIYTAQGSEQYIIIGNFYSDSLTDTLRVNPSGTIAPYYYIDDVSVVENPDTVSVFELENESSISIYPNPSAGEISIVSEVFLQSPQLYISDITGKIVFEKRFDAEQKRIELNTGLPPGIYFLKIKDKDSWLTKKIIIN